jgi:LuxR family maltose regulon positive regulatory protein
MSIPILITKIMLPPWREEILSRTRLTCLFDELLDKKLIILSAPAGYGKTSLLLDVAHHNEMPFCWYSLDALDQEFDRFLAHFIASIKGRFPSFGEQSMSVLQGMSQDNTNTEEIGVVIINEIFQTIREHFVIVLDDYQMIDQNQQINSFINHFIQNVDQNCHMVITSRSVLPLADLSLMVGRSLVGGLGLLELAFQPDEIQALMLKNYQQVIPDAIALELAQRTEGWITGLLLSAQTMWQGMVNQLRLARVSGVDLYSYLMQQVLNQQPQEMRDFLMQSAFLYEFNADLCEAVFGEPPPGDTWQGILDRVLRQNLFVHPVGEAGSWLHYHRLFSDFLQAQYVQEHPSELDNLLKRLSEVYADREEWEKAYSFCQRLGNPEITAELLEKAGETMVVNGRIALLRSWLEALPVDIIHERPILLARYGIVLAAQKETTRGLQMLDQSVALLRADDKLTHLAGTLVWRALSHYLRGEYPQALADVNEVFSLIANMHETEELVSFQAEAHRIAGQCYRMMGDVTAATNGLTQALELFKRLGDKSGINRVLLLMGLLYLDSGNFKAAMICYRQVLDYYQKQQNIYSSASVLNDIAYIQYLKGEYLEAFSTYNDALAKARQSGNARVEGLVLIGLADIFTDLGEFTEAIDQYRQGRMIVETIKEVSLVIYINLAKAVIARLRNDTQQAHIYLDSAKAFIQESKGEFSRGQYLLQSALLAIAEEDYRLALNILTEANDSFVTAGQRIDEIRASGLLAAVHYELKHTRKASQYLEHAACLAAELDGRNILLQTVRQVKGILSRMASSGIVGLPAMRLLEEVNSFESDLPRLKKKLRAQDSLVLIKPPRLRIRTLGQIQVLLDEKMVTGADWQTLVTRDLLLLILANPQGMNKEQIGEILWPEISPSRLKQRFKNSIYRLRRALNQDVIQYLDGIYSFNRKVDYEYDVEAFEHFLTQARATTPLEEQVKAFQSAIEMYQGEYLPGLDWGWVTIERERLLQEFLKAGLSLAELYAENRQYHKSLELCNRLITFAPWVEDAYRIAMNVNAYIGNRGAIAQLYRNLRQGLMEYAAADPSPQTDRLYRSLMA